MTQRAAEDLSTLSGRVIADLRGLQDLFAGGARLDLASLIERNLGLIGVIATTCLVLLASRRLLRPVFWNIARRAGRSGWLASGLWLFASFLLDALPVLFAYAVGQGMALGICGEPGQVSLHQSLYLNAFLLVELVKALLRALIMPRHASLRLLPVSDPSAAFAYRRSASIASLLGYGLMVATPIVTGQITVAVGRASGVLFMLIALVLALFGIWRLKGRLARDARQNGQTDDLTGQVLSVIQRLWPWLATLRARLVSVADGVLVVELVDGRKISVPVAWYPRLAHGNAAEQNHWRLIGQGEGIHWPDLDEDVSVEGLLAGRHSAESAESFSKWLAGRKKAG
jgi:small conductance mechanosensitive channel